MNLFSLTSLVIFFSSIVFGITIYAGDRNSKINRSWLILSITIAFWGLGLYGVTSTESAHTALLWQYLLDVSAIFIPVSFLYFILIFTDVSERLWLRLSIICGTALALFSFTPVYKLGVASRYGFYWINPGPGYIIFPIFFTFIVILSIFILGKSYSQNKDRVFRAQIGNIFLAGTIGFGGGLTNFFPQIFNVYPFGNYLVILYLFFISYGVLKYRLMSRKIIAAQIFSGAMVLVFLFNLLQPVLSVTDWLIKFLLFMLVGFFSVLLVRGVYSEVKQRELIQKQEQELEVVNHQQEGLLHFISHEVKGYLTKNEAGFAAITEGDYGAVSEPLKTMAASALEDTRRGVNTVMDILDASNLKKGTIAYEKKRFDFSSAVQDIVNSLKPMAQEKGISLEYTNNAGGASTIDGDENKLRRHVIRNLIDNSIRYTPSGSVRVEISKTDNALRMTVTDTGVGITPEDMTRLFKEGGHGSDSIKVNVHSTGYGLYIAKSIVEAHGGKIWAESEGKDRGSRFIVELPVA